MLYAFPRARGRADGGRPRLGLSVSRRVGGAVDRTRVKRVLREAFWAEAERLPAGSDYVVVARPEARELAEREGMAGVRAALAELVERLGGAAAGRARERRARRRPRARSARTGASSRRRCRARCKYHPSCSAYAVQAIERFGILRGAVLAVWRLLRCNPFSHGGLRPRRARRRCSAAARPSDCVTLLDPCSSSPTSSSR